MKDINAKSAANLNPSKPVIATVIACISAALFLCLTALVISEVNGGSVRIIAAIDDPVRFMFYNLRTPWLTSLVLPFTHSCDWYWITGGCIVLLIIPATRKKAGVPIAAGAITATIINNPIKWIVARPRPDDIIHLVTESSSSFPSGHSITGICVYGLAIILIRKYIKNTAVKNILTVFLVIPMVGIGLSRIYCGVHFPTDVLAGWLLGISIMLAVYSAIISKTHD